jgi:hypothetical protein
MRKKRAASPGVFDVCATPAPESHMGRRGSSHGSSEVITAASKRIHSRCATEIHVDEKTSPATQKAISLLEEPLEPCAVRQVLIGAAAGTTYATGAAIRVSLS